MKFKFRNVFFLCFIDLFFLELKNGCGKYMGIKIIFLKGLDLMRIFVIFC